jgi:hypothetical protein
MNPARSVVRFFCTPARGPDVGVILTGFTFVDHGTLVPEYHGGYAALCECLDETPVADLSRMACVVDLDTELQTWDVVRDLHPLHPSWLVWRYPEVYWIFLVDDLAELPAELPPIAKKMHFATPARLSDLKEQLSRHVGGMRGWFDPWELRRSALFGPARDRSDLPPGPLPIFGDWLGVVFDDEVGYAVFNGYLLYRRNIPVCIAATVTEFGALAPYLKTSEQRDLVVLEDVELNYAEGKSDLWLMPTSQLKIAQMLDGRAGLLGFAARPPAVHLYVSATVVPRADSANALRQVDTVLKPVAGLDEPGILRAIWPLRVPDWIRDQTGGTHCAPADAQQIAAALLVRARVLEQDSSNTLSALHGALLAFESERLLANQTYAMTMQSLAMRYWFEAMAECVFAGATDELTVAPRMQELRSKMVKLVYHTDKVALPRALWTLFKALLANDPDVRLNWMKLHKRRVQVANGMLEVLSRLRDVYDLHRKAEEEEHVLHAIRRWRVKLFQLKRPLSTRVADRQAATPGDPDWMGLLAVCQVLEGAWRIALAAPLYYVTQMLKPAWLFVAVLGWIGLAALGYSAIADTRIFASGGGCGPTDWLLHSAVTFVAMQQGIFGDPKQGCMDNLVFEADGHLLFWCLTLAEMAVGYFHLGLLVAVLVQKITRR